MTNWHRAYILYLRSQFCASFYHYMLSKIFVSSELKVNGNNAEHSAVVFLQLFLTLFSPQHIIGPTHNHGLTLDLITSCKLSVELVLSLSGNVLNHHSLVLIE